MQPEAGTPVLSVRTINNTAVAFYEGPMLTNEQDAIDVLHKIAKFNGAPMPTLTIEDFREIDRAMGIDPAAQAAASGDAKGIFSRLWKNISFLKGLFATKIGTFTFVLLGLAYMVSL